MLKDLDPKEVHDHFEEYEATFLHVYLDSKGFPTIGRGCLITPPFVPAEYGEWVMPDGSPARIVDVLDDFDRVMKDARWQQTHGNAQDHAAPYYAKLCSTRLTQASAEALFLARLYKEEIRLVQLYGKSYETAPLPAQFGTLDMAYSMGADRLRALAVDGGFPAWSEAFEKRQYAKCAVESLREPGNASFDARNKWTADKFMEAENV